MAVLGRIANVRARFTLALSSAVALTGLVATSAPQCLAPYGGVDPLLKQLWLMRVGESQPLFDAPHATAFGYAALPLVGLAATCRLAWSTRRRGWLILSAFQLTSVLVMIGQLRGAYPAAILAAPALAAVILAARRSGALALAGAWIASAGMLYPIAAQAMTRSRPGPSGASCTAPDLISALGALPQGNVMAPIDAGAPAIAGTRQRLIAGAYHRDGAGDLAMYAFYRGTADDARVIAERWRVRWVVACDGFGEVSAPFATQLQQGHAPAWLKPAVKVPSRARIYEVVVARPKMNTL